MDPDDPPPPVDGDLNGIKLLGDPNPLERARALLQPLRTLHIQDARAWVVIAKVASRRGASCYVLLRFTIHDELI